MKGIYAMGASRLTAWALLIWCASAAYCQTYTVLRNFASGDGGPANPTNTGRIAQGRDGNLYSATQFGGTNNLGTVFNITPAGTVTVLHSFTATEGSPQGGLTLGTDGNFYGTTANGGIHGAGTIFKVSPAGVLTVLYNFAGVPCSGGGFCGDGAVPTAAPIQGTDSNWYGTTTDGGTEGGTVYRMTPTGAETVLHSFVFGGGSQPVAGLAQGTDGNLYGTTRTGGNAGGQGVVFKVSRTGTYAVLFNLDGTHGSLPLSPIAQALDGNFYGTAQNGGSFNNGVLFRITQSGKLTVLRNLNGAPDGGQPVAGLVQATDQNLYGVDSGGGSIGPGTIFRISPTGANYAVLHNFDGFTGGNSDVTLIQHTNGILYGDTQGGGSGNAGVFYYLNASLPPFVSILPSPSTSGSSIQILGQGFVGTTAVSFNGVAAQFSVQSATFLTATVPGAATSGFVTVTTPTGTLTSNTAFGVAPKISGFSPASGPVGQAVTITGVSLLQTSRVTFGGVKAAGVTVNSNTKVTAVVPTGAITGKIVITTPGGTAQSAASFTVTP